MAIVVSASDDGALAALARLIALLEDPTPAYKAIGATLERRVNQRFDLKEGPDGKPWAAWSDAVRELREEEGRGTLLEYTGRMRDSLGDAADASGVEVGFGAPYALFHEFGTARMPARPLLTVNGQLSTQDEEAVLAAALRAFKKTLAA